MLKRASRGAFPSAHVFPGGVVDAADHATAADLSHGKVTYNELRITAVRELFEETGYFLTSRKAPLPSASRLLQWRKEIYADATRFSELHRQTSSLPPQDLVQVARFITPLQYTRRFDARFFIHILEDSEGLNSMAADGEETFDLEWTTPESVLRRAFKGEVILVDPQIHILTELMYCESLDAVRDYLRRCAASEPPAWCGRLLRTKQLTSWVFPGDVDFDQAHPHGEMVELKPALGSVRNRIGLLGPNGESRLLSVERCGIPGWRDVYITYRDGALVTRQSTTAAAAANM